MRTWLRLSTSCASTVHPRCCAADNAVSQPPAEHCVNVRSTAGDGIRVHVRPGQDQLIGARRALAAVPRPGTLAAARMPRGLSAQANRPANRPAIPPRVVGLFGRVLSHRHGPLGAWPQGACSGGRRWAHVPCCLWGESASQQSAAESCRRFVYSFASYKAVRSKCFPHQNCPQENAPRGPPFGFCWGAKQVTHMQGDAFQLLAFPNRRGAGPSN